MRCTVHISHRISFGKRLHYQNTVSVNGEFFSHGTYKVCERVKNFLKFVLKPNIEF